MGRWQSSNTVKFYSLASYGILWHSLNVTGVKCSGISIQRECPVCCGSPCIYCFVQHDLAISVTVSRGNHNRCFLLRIWPNWDGGDYGDMFRSSLIWLYFLNPLRWGAGRAIFKSKHKMPFYWLLYCTHLLAPNSQQLYCCLLYCSTYTYIILNARFEAYSTLKLMWWKQHSLWFISMVVCDVGCQVMKHIYQNTHIKSSLVQSYGM